MGGGRTFAQGATDPRAASGCSSECMLYLRETYSLDVVQTYEAPTGIACDLRNASTHTRTCTGVSQVTKMI